VKGDVAISNDGDRDCFAFLLRRNGLAMTTGEKGEGDTWGEVGGIGMGAVKYNLILDRAYVGRS
jgi:hypothetical protein